MANLFSLIPTRANGQRILHGWFDVLRLAGVALESYVGSGFIGETSATLANNSAATDVVGLLFDKTLYTSALVNLELRRKTDSNEAVAVGTLALIYRTGIDEWEVVPALNGDGGDDGAGVIFSVTSAGQVQYSSDNMAGTNYVGTFKFKAISFNI